MTRHRNLTLTLLFAIMVSVTGCAIAPTRGIVHTSTRYEDTFRAAAQALIAAGFSIKSSDQNTGVISAERTVRQSRQDRQYTFNVLVRQEAARTVVEAGVAAPHGSIAGTRTYYDAFLAALKRQLPDVVVVGS